jgi:hypothetical protein
MRFNIILLKLFITVMIRSRPAVFYNRPVQNCNLSDPRRALVYGRFLGIFIHLKFLSPRVFLVQMTFEFKIKNTLVFNILLERKYELTVLNLNSKIMSKHIFPHFYSLEAPVLWRPHRRKLALSRKHFRNAFLMK